jgi:hypothetical protein
LQSVITNCWLLVQWSIKFSVIWLDSNQGVEPLLLFIACVVFSSSTLWSYIIAKHSNLLLFFIFYLRFFVWIEYCITVWWLFCSGTKLFFRPSMEDAHCAFTDVNKSFNLHSDTPQSFFGVFDGTQFSSYSLPLCSIHCLWCVYVVWMFDSFHGRQIVSFL